MISNKRIRNMNAGEIELNVHKVEDKMFFGYEKTDVGDTTVFISNSEKTLIDCIYFSDIVYLGEIKKFIEVMKNKLDLEKIKRYLRKIYNLSLNKRTGYLLELCGLDTGKIKINNKYTRLNKNLEKKGELNKKWKIIVNERL
ncbi:MAG: type IV toxin-antitoxin system AbiEi family antitoxin domain-containing protein [Minisyncoccales bacterium]